MYEKKEAHQKIWMIMRLCILFVCVLQFSVFARGVAQDQVVSLEMQNVSYFELFNEIHQQTGLRFIYNTNQLEGMPAITVHADKQSVKEVLEGIFLNTPFTFSFEQNVVMVKMKQKDEEKEKESLTVKGIVYDKKKQPLPGVTVLVKGTTLGVSTSEKGVFKIEVPNKDVILVFSFVGMKSKEIKLNELKDKEILAGKKDLEVILEESVESLEDVVITGYANIRKSSFTGSATQVKREDILQVSKGNLIDALQVFDPSLRVIKNKEMGADPNTLPEFYIRGRSGIASVKELDQLESEDVSEFALTNNPNLPIFILDGFEVEIEKIYDLDLNRIRDITILKDAAATAVYGSRASNGVIVIETIAPLPGELRISYSGNLAITAPDLSSYNLMNAEEKLQAEWAAGLYEPWGLSTISEDSELNSLMWYYMQKHNRVLIGTDNYWLSQPLQTEWNHKHSLYIEGGSENFRFGIELRYDNQDGVMKDSYRNRKGVGLTLDYRYKGLQIRNKISYDIVKSEDSPYGSFRDYTSKQPYEYWRDPETGELLKETTQWGNYGGNTLNPLYEAATGNFSKNGYNEWINNLSLNWYLNSSFLIKGQLAISLKEENSSKFTDPASGSYGRVDLFQKGDLMLSETNTVRWDFNLLASYNKTIAKHNINFAAGINIVSTDNSYSDSQYRGFPDADRNSPAYAYEIVKKPTFSDNKTRLIGGFLMLNYSFNDIYLFDGSYRFDGSSEFGSERKWAPFWSIGAGINFHNYSFWTGIPWMTLFKLKANIGETGKANFSPYMAKNIYNIILDDWYPTGIGVEPIYLGNNNLTWEKQLSWNIGTEMEFYQGRVQVDFDFYNKRTRDLITEVSIPSSSGYSKYMDNMGEVQNKGFEVDLNLRLFEKEDWSVILFGNIAHNKNKVLKISESLKEYNERVNDFFSNYSIETNPQLVLGVGYDNLLQYVSPIMKYEEGSSLTALYGMKSLGINPANGKEVYLKRDGTITYDWSASEQQVIGDEEPWGQGAFGLNVRFRQFTLYTTFLYEFGGDAYNETLITNVETANLNTYNVDRRVWTERWQKVGDVTPLKSIKDRYYVTRPTSRFIQKNNYLTFNSLSLGYDFKRELLKRIGLSSLGLQFNMKDIVTFSTIKQEMGLSYPFARTFTFTLNASF